MVAMRAERPSQLSEDELDMMIEDSFPASDPPSHTPISGMGSTALEDRGGWFSKKKVMALAGGVVTLVAAGIVAITMMKKRSASAEPVEA